MARSKRRTHIPSRESSEGIDATQLRNELSHINDHSPDTVRLSSHKRKHSRVNASRQDGITFERDEQELLGRQGSKRHRSQDYSATNASLVSRGCDNNEPISFLEDAEPASPVSPRSSRFIEGSMNDKVSMAPPNEYLSHEGAIVNYHNESFTRGQTCHRGRSVTEEEPAGQRTSGIFRFGKALVSAFTPVTSWFKAQPDVPDQQNIARNEEKARVEDAYAKLKNSGYKMSGSTVHVGQTQRLEGERVNIFDMPSGVKQDDTGLVDQRSTPQTPKRYGRLFDEHDGRASTTNLNTRSRSQSRDIFENEPTNRSSVHNRRPSLQNLHKVASYLQIPSSRRRSASPAVFQADQGVTMSKETLALQADAQKFISKEDSRKQKKLSKQVSDLETKLDRARRELQAVMGPPPVPDKQEMRGRKMFVPGSLPTLPSERLLKHQDDDEDEDGDSPVGVVSTSKTPALTTSSSTTSLKKSTPRPSTSKRSLRVQREPQSESPGPTPPKKDSPKRKEPHNESAKSQTVKKIAKKRKVQYSDESEGIKEGEKDGDYNPSSHVTSSGENDDSHFSDSSSGVIQKKQVYKPSKLQKVTVVNSPGSAEKKGRIWPKENLMYSGSVTRNKSTPDLSSTIRNTQTHSPLKSSIRRPVSPASKRGPKSPGSSKRLQTSPKSRRSISPYPYSSPERKKRTASSPSDRPFTAIPGSNTKDGEVVPPLPSMPTALVDNSLKTKDPKLDVENVLKIRSGQKKIVVEDGKSMQEKMHVKGKMSIADSKKENENESKAFEWPPDCF